MSRLHCFVYQKHIDLHAVSALEAIHAFMNVVHCKGLTRYVHWIVDVETDSNSFDFFSMITQKSYYLLNPNKEAFLTELTVSNHEGVNSIYIDVFPNISLDYSGFVEKINQHCGTSITHIQKRITWRCDVTSSQDPQEFALSHLLPSEHQSGILANPIYESFCFLGN